MNHSWSLRFGYITSFHLILVRTGHYFSVTTPIFTQFWFEHVDISCNLGLAFHIWAATRGRNWFNIVTDLLEHCPMNHSWSLPFSYNTCFSLNLVRTCCHQLWSWVCISHLGRNTEEESVQSSDQICCNTVQWIILGPYVSFTSPHFTWFWWEQVTTFLLQHLVLHNFVVNMWTSAVILDWHFTSGLQHGGEICST
jgi:hypothetical protein